MLSQTRIKTGARASAAIFFVAIGMLLAMLAAEPAPDEAHPFKFTGGEKPLGDTALHKDWKLAWEDDFSKDKTIDKAKWNFEINGNGGGNIQAAS